MVKRGICLLLIVLMVISFSHFISAIECGSVPTNNCDVTQNTTFIQGNYSLPNGINIRGIDILALTALATSIPGL